MILVKILSIIHDLLRNMCFTYANNHRSPLRKAQPDMANQQEEKDRYTEFLKNLSDEYRGEKFRWLRFLLCDYLKESLLKEKDVIAFDLFNEIRVKNIIKHPEVNLLSEIAEVTDVPAAKLVIKDYENGVKRGRTLPPNRKALFEALKELQPGDFRKLQYFYKLKKCCVYDKWDLVLHLEIKGRLDNTKEKIKQFADILSDTKAKDKLSNLSTLTETGENLQSTSSVEQLGVYAPSEPKELNRKNFNVMLIQTALWYQDRNKLTMLKLLFTNDVKASTEYSDVYSLFEALVESRKIYVRNYKYLIDMVKVTDTRGVVEDVKLLSDANKDGKITSFTPYRQTLMEMGKVLSPDEAKRVGNVYEVPQNAYTDQWSLIMHLEKTKNVFADGAKEIIQYLKYIGLHHVALKLKPITTNKRSNDTKIPRRTKKRKR
ncbi:uncharacterized protein [Antedon mediterranea]|uniref:uncharacterized protein n=1 Tax=Antedon mediterranea TaxID=105859 RepID=UPI003AF9B948